MPLCHLQGFAFTDKFYSLTTVNPYIFEAYLFIKKGNVINVGSPSGC